MDYLPEGVLIGVDIGVDIGVRVGVLWTNRFGMCGHCCRFFFADFGVDIGVALW